MRLPLATTLKNRSSSRARDARLLNAVVDSRKRVQKRPSLVQVFTEIDAGAGLGLFVRNVPGTTDNPDGSGGLGPGAGGTGSGESQELIVINNNNSGTDGTLTTSPTTYGNFLTFSQQPADWKILTNMSPAVTVTAIDAFGSTATGFNGQVTISLYSNPNGGILSGTTTVNAVNGIATFSNLVIDKVGAGYSFRAIAPALFGGVVISNFFSIKSYLRFTVQPTSALPNTAISPAIKVSVVDSAGTAISSYTGLGYNIKVDLPDSINTGILSGDKTQQASAGVSEFDNLQINNEGAYLFQAEADVIAIGNLGLVKVYSDNFQIIDATHTLVADQDGTVFGYVFSSSFGSMTPMSFGIYDIIALYTENDTMQVNGTFLQMSGVVPQNAFTTITFNNKTLNSADAQYSASANTEWYWPSEFMFTATGTYLGDIV